MNFDKKWGDMSPEEKDAAKSKYGNKQGWRDAKAKSQGYKDQSDKKEQKGQSTNAAMKNAGTSTGQSGSSSQPSSNSKPQESSPSYRSPRNNNNNTEKPASKPAAQPSGGNKSYTDTANGRIEAPSWYRNLDGSTPSTMQEGLTEEGWNKSLDTARANKAQTMANEKKDEMLGRITQNAYQTGGYGDEWNTYTQGMSQSEITAAKKGISENVQSMKSDSMEDQQQAKYEINQAGGETSTKYGSARGAFASNKEQGDFYMTNPTHDDYEGYDAEDPTNAANETVASKLMQSGHDFSWADYGMHRNGGAQNSAYNYDAYGGYDNWYNNHSAYSEGGWKGSQNVMDSGAIASADQKRREVRNQYQLSDEYMNKYGHHQWAQNYYNNNNINK